MKTSLLILIILMALMALWSACQFDIVNTVMAMISIPVLIIGFAFLKTIKNETEK